MLDKVLVMKPRRSHLVKSTPVESAVDTTIDNVYGEPRQDRFDEIIDLLKQGNIYGEPKDITLGAVEVPIEKQISIDKASTKGLKSEEYKLEYTDMFEEYKSLFEFEIEGYMNRTLNVTVEEFYEALKSESDKDEDGNRMKKSLKKLESLASE